MKTLKIKTALMSFLVMFNLLGCITGFAATSAAASKQEIRQGLVAYWPLDILSATTPDLSGNKNHLQAINLTAADVVPGKHGNAISFNGINSLLLCFAKNGVGLPAYSHSSCTVAMWVKGNTANETGRVFSESTNLRNPLVAISTDRRAPEGVVEVYLRADNSNTLISHHRTSLIAFEDVWHHIAWVDENGKTRLYVDGIQDTSRIDYTREPITPTLTALGGVMRFDTVRFAFQRLIDEAAIWSRALTDAEIRLVMKKGLANFLPKNNIQSQNQSIVAEEQINSAQSLETVKDADGNIYHTVKIGNQVWTVENLRTTKFNDGTPIPHVADDQQWKTITTPGYCYYENNPEHAEKYGILYNWYAASSEKIAPKGWRVPTREEQLKLQEYLIANGYNYDGTTEGNKVAKSMATKTGWIYKPTDEGGGSVSDIGTVGKDPETNNSTGFSAVPSGSRWCDASFHALGTSQYWWSATPYNDVSGYMSSVHTWFAKYGDNNHKKRSGFSIRLIRDDNNKGSKAATMIPESFGDPDKIDVLVVTGGLGIDRDQFFALFNGRDDIQCVEYPLKDESEVFEDISDWKYDVLLLYNATQDISQKRRNNLVSLLKDKGIGLVVVHHAQAAFQNWLEFHKINGSAFIYYDVKIDGNIWPHSKCKGGMDIPVTIFDKEHPITRGLTDFRVLDETYKDRWWAKDNHVLLTTSHPENDEPVAWTRQYGKSRVFNIQLGHDYHTYEVPQYRDLIIRGIFWTDGAQEAPGSGDSVGESKETVKDADGNIYHTVRIGNQLWTVENLRTTRYNDGTPIPNITETEEWKSITTPGYCNYENNPENGKKYGILYNWYAASSDKIAPKGWRVPTLDEQIALMDYLIANGYNYDGTTEENKVAKSMAAKTDWICKATNEGGGPVSDIGTVGNNPETNNRSGFSALPTGSRWNDGSFHSIGESVYWWSSTPVSGDDAHLSYIKSWLAKYGFIQHHKRSGFCIRLVRDLDNKEGKKDESGLSTPGNTGTMNLPEVTISDIQKGLVAYWPLDNLSTTTPDLSGNRNHLQAINLISADVVSGKKGNAISFNGINSLLLCFAANGSGLPACSHPASTVAMWVKGSTSNETGRVFSETTNAYSPLVAISTDSRAPEGVVDLFMRADNDNTLVSHHRTSLVAFDNAWHHIAWVDDRGNPRLYVDGVADTNSCTYTHQPITPTLTALGGVMREDSVRFVFKGLIDEAAIWSRALSDAEISFMMNTGFSKLTSEISKN